MPNARMSAAGGFSTCGASYLDFYVQIKHIFSKPEASSLFLLGLFTAFLILVGSRPSPRPLSLFKPVFLHFVGSLAGFGPPGNICFTHWRFTATLPHAREKAAAMPELGPFLPAIFGASTPVCARACCCILSRRSAALGLC